MPEDSNAPTSARRRWTIVGVLAAITLIVALVVLTEAGDRPDDDVPTAGPRPAAGDAPRAADDSEPPAVAALRSVALPGDATDLFSVLDDMPDQLAGRSRVLDAPEGEVLYASGAEEPLFIVAMEADDMGVRDETNGELLEIEARRAGRTVSALETGPAAPVLYVAGTEDADRLHFLLWSTPDSPFVFAAGADSAAHLEELVRAFVSAAD